MTVHVRRFDVPPADMAEVLRYAACREATDEVRALAESAVNEGAQVIRPQVCWLETAVQTGGDSVDLGFTRVTSQELSRHLAGCRAAVVFAATVGLELDRLIARHGRLSPARGLLLQAFGAERIEALCDAFCAGLAAEYAAKGLHTRPRFSPGYGDLPLQSQRAVFQALACDRHIGLYLNESLLMSPTKSVTAIVGLCGTPAEGERQGCAACTRRDCSFRRG